jgi:putative protein kinase ArgK-like GTPase of G3E family
MRSHPDAAGFDKVIVETVGVGQDEVEIVKTADVSVVVLVPGMGDDIQAIKAGIMEIGTFCDWKQTAKAFCEHRKSLRPC